MKLIYKGGRWRYSNGRFAKLEDIEKYAPKRERKKHLKKKIKKQYNIFYDTKIKQWRDTKGHFISVQEAEKWYKSKKTILTRSGKGKFYRTKTPFREFYSIKKTRSEYGIKTYSIDISDLVYIKENNELIIKEGKVIELLRKLKKKALMKHWREYIYLDLEQEKHKVEYFYDEKEGTYYEAAETVEINNATYSTFQVTENMRYDPKVLIKDLKFRWQELKRRLVHSDIKTIQSNSYIVLKQWGSRYGKNRSKK